MSLVEWFERERGIRPATLDHFGVTFPDDQTAVFPYSNGDKTRKVLPDGTRRFYFTEGKKPALFNMQARGCKTVFLVEGETDTMRLRQELDDENVSNLAIGVVGLSGINSWRPEFADALADAEKVFVVLDNDQDYNVRSQVDVVWRQIRSDLGSKARRIHLPSEPTHVKDVCEFFENYDLDILRDLAKKKAAGVSRYKPLDLRQEPPPPNWLVEGLISKGDVTVLHGDGGLGKSWLTMGVTIAVAQSLPTFLGKDVLKHGRVLYADEENPDDVVFTRLTQLGLNDEGRRNIRYLWNQGIRLDKRPEEFLEEALDYEPNLVVLDSLSRIHSQDENAAGAMGSLFDEGIKPLARETGAAVLVIHHDNKSGGHRGSADIVNAPDNILQMRGLGEENPGKFILRQGKSRRRAGGEEVIVSIKDAPDGSVYLDTTDIINAPF